MTYTGIRAGRPSAGSYQSGFTLVELVLSFSLMVVVVGCAYACLSAGFSAQKTIEPRTDVLQSARVALALLSADLRAACVLPGGTDFIGMQRLIGEARADNIDFATHNYSPSRQQEGDFCEISYFLDRHPETGQLCLWRRRNPMIAMDPLAGGRREEIVAGVRGLEFQYYDGLDWYHTWGDPDGRDKRATSARSYGNLYGLPEAIRVILLMDAESRKPRKNGNSVPEEKEPVPPLVFTTVVRLNLATSSASSAAGSLNQASGQTQGQEQNVQLPTPGPNQ